MRFRLRRPAGWTWLAGIAVVAIVAAGYSRLTLDMDLFSLLPADSRQAQGLKLYQEAFGSSQELVISLRAGDRQAAAAAAESMAGALQASGLASQVLWRNPLEDPHQLASLIAFVWQNEPPEKFHDMTERFAGPQLDATLDATLERLGSSLEPQQVARLARDPYRLTEALEAVSTLQSTSGQGGGDPLVSDDGRFRIVLVAPPFESGGFARQRQWTRNVKHLVARWQQDQGAAPASVKVTGNPALVAESGSELLEDITWAALGTLLVVVALFWLAHRSWRPLLRLAGLLVVVLGITLGLGGLLLGRINIVSLGFAAILLGLAADYGLILQQELQSYPERSRTGHRRAVAPSVLWAAATSAGAFFMLTRSSLPGVDQLGALVGLGMLTAAAVMLTGFLAPLGRDGQDEPLLAPADPPGSSSASARWRPRVAWLVTAATAAAILAVFLLKGAPEVNYAADALGFRRAPARDALVEVGQEVGQRSDSLWIIVPGASVEDVSERLGRIRGILDRATDGGVLSHYVLPAAIWPNPAWQRENGDRLSWLVERQQAALDAAQQSGFTPESLTLTRNVFDAWRRMAGSDGVVWPEGPGADWILREFSTEQNGRFLLLGRAAAGDKASNGAVTSLGTDLREAAGADLLGWSLLSDSLLGSVQRDVKRVVAPMLAVLLLLLAVAFRHLREMVLSVAVLGLSAAGMLALMTLAGWTWNLMNVMALALLLGTAVDYSIHVQYALRRYGGEAGSMRRTVGRAILLCGASTAAGFGTLGFSSNAGLASLGQVCAVGIVVACLISVYLLPTWWRGLAGIRGDAAEKAT